MNYQITKSQDLALTASAILVAMVGIYLLLRDIRLSESVFLEQPIPIFSNESLLEKNNIPKNVWDIYSSSALSAGYNPAKAAFYADQLIIERNKRFPQVEK